VRRREGKRRVRREGKRRVRRREEGREGFGFD